MLHLSKKLTHQNIGNFIQTILYFTLFFMYLWLEIDVRFIQHISGASTEITVFYCEWSFFNRLMSLPGGAIQYICTFLVQFFRYASAGALLVTLQAWLIAVCTDTIIRAIGLVRFRWFRFVGPTLILITYTLYSYQFVTTMAFLTVLFFACLYLKTQSMRQVYSTVIFMAMSIVLYYLAAGAFLCFAAICIIWELFFTRRRYLSLLIAAAGLALPWIMGDMFFGLSSGNAYSELTPWTWRSGSFFLPSKVKPVMRILYFLLPAFMLLTAILVPTFKYLAGIFTLGFKPRSAGTLQVKSRRAGKKPIVQRTVGIKNLWWIIRTAILCIAAGVSVWSFHDSKVKALLAIDYYNHHRMWPEVIREAERIPYALTAINARNRALYHTGRLSSEMFKYPQHLHGLLLISDKFSEMYWKKFDLYAELGLVNMAENLLTDSMGTFGEHPVILKQLAKLNMAKGNMATAEVYLKALSKAMLFGDWARMYLAKIEEDPTLAHDKEIQYYRSLSIKNDNLVEFLSVENTLLALLEKNPDNRMAFEYLMAFYLLSKDVNKFVEHLNRLDDLGYTQIPRHYEEAILVYNSVHPDTPFSLPGRQISMETRQQAQHIVQIIQRYGGNKQAAYNEVAETYSDSYIFYSLYANTGTGK